MRRAALTFKAASNDEITLIRHPVSPAGFERDKYYQNKEFFQYVFYEYIKMY